jgi:leucyl-tRNA synthetase
MGLLNGAKMSSSKGNVFLLEDALAEFGADTVRMFLMGSAEPWQDFDWRNELVASTRRQIERFEATVRDAIAAPDLPGTADDWLLSRLQRRIARATAALDAFQTRQALQEAFFGVEADLRWYSRRQPEGAVGGPALRELCSVWVRLLAPFIPFTCETLWRELGNDDLVAFAPWPVADRARDRPALELGEELLARTVEDVESILKLLPITPAAVEIAVAPAWKREVFRTIASADDRNSAVRFVMLDEGMRRRGKEAADAAKQVTTLIHRLPPDLVESLLGVELDERAVFEGARAFLERAIGLPVRVVGAEESAHPKAAGALPFKPAITVE